MNKTLRTIGNVYVALMLIVYPLILTNKYFNVTDTKLIVFYCFTVGLLLATAGIIYLRWLRGGLKDRFVLPRYLWIGCGTIALSGLITFLISTDKAAALTGHVEYGLGLIYIVLSVASIIALSVTGFDSVVFCLGTVTGAVIAGIFGFIQYIGVDLFGMLSSITVEDKNNFLSTLGNTSFFGFFMVFAFPIASYIYLELDSSYKYIASVAIVVTSIGVVISNTDATVLAFIVEAIMVILLTGNNVPQNIKKLHLFAGLVNTVAFSFIGLFIFTSLVKPEREIGGVQSVFINPMIWIPVLIVVNGIYLWGKVNKFYVSLSFRTLRIIGCVCMAFILLMPIIALIYTFVTYINLDSPISRLLYLDVNWGNRRGFIWSGTIQIFNDGSFLEKLVGRGIGTMSDLFQETYEVELREIYHSFYDDAHNIYLQCLVEYGLFGLVSLVYLLCNSFMHLRKSTLVFNNYRAITLIGIIISSSCLITQNITPAFFILILAVYDTRSQ